MLSADTIVRMCYQDLVSAAPTPHVCDTDELHRLRSSNNHFAATTEYCVPISLSATLISRESICFSHNGAPLTHYRLPLAEILL